MIVGLWLSLVVITATGAGAEYLFGGAVPVSWFVLAEGAAAGAMLTMIASSIIHEAVQLGNGPSVGLGTLAGFLSAITFKLLE